jgi:hypothetical protein
LTFILKIQFKKFRHYGSESGAEVAEIVNFGFDFSVTPGSPPKARSQEPAARGH